MFNYEDPYTGDKKARKIVLKPGRNLNGSAVEMVS